MLMSETPRRSRVLNWVVTSSIVALALSFVLYGYRLSHRGAAKVPDVTVSGELLVMSMVTTSGSVSDISAQSGVRVQMYCMEVINEWTPCRDVKEGDEFLGRIPDKDYSLLLSTAATENVPQVMPIERGWTDDGNTVKLRGRR